VRVSQALAAKRDKNLILLALPMGDGQDVGTFRITVWAEITSHVSEDQKHVVKACSICTGPGCLPAVPESQWNTNSSLR
jgi:hypothetical protein